ncbi:BRCT domain-containing protein [Aliarcobacter butzleri]|uniref:BRCT domain-containing protein n=1 Tax=Aliarcobacter butzleri TaxID=28197 RepID=UPI00214CA463|nr:BRCT domain-containing protein [Aliarcobacter butzleri]MCG3717961.1 BRCT domain-containing protein [Aliarcobacter butzleri]MCP3649962.1 BRCT domain-containing protein [Arcobacter sp. DNRA7]MCR1816135.1 BRCT domain-containing protein [Aliarcobacter butzleri]MDK2063990.1 BRCT domain-containing protein [Aliarcobacter butzleri]
MKNYRVNEIRDRNIDEIIGISRGLLADGVINESEAKFLLSWIESHFNYEDLNNYPLNTIYDRLKEVLKDNVLDEEEAKEIKELLESFTGGTPIIKQVKSMSSTLPLCNPLPDVIIKEKTFCFTGAFTIGTRTQCEIIIKSLGGNTKKEPSGQVDYLVIGILGSADWIHSSYGRKIEKAVDLRDKKESGIKIITEEHFIKFL